MASTRTVQNLVDNAKSFGDLNPILDSGGYTDEPALTCATDVMNKILENYPYKWNEMQCPVFYTNSYQQDYAILGLTTLAYLTNGIAINITSSAIAKPWTYVEVNRYQGQSTASQNHNSFYSSPLFKVNWLPNNQLYYGTWGMSNTGNATWGNNPVSGSVYTNPLTATAMPANPITQIKDANGNFLVLTGYGTEGTTAPVAPAASLPGVTATPGVGATTTWKVIDPTGQGFRIVPPPSQTGAVWQFNLVGQAIPIRFTTLGQTLAPCPDDYEPHFRALFIALCYSYSPEAKIAAKFAQRWQLAMQSLVAARTKSDREPDEIGFVVERTILGAGGGMRGAFGNNPFNPFR
jgi:hypothetical protein